jgi:hypothetical protein
MMAVTRLAEASRQVSSRMSSSMRLVFAGAQVGWITNTSMPRTFSPSSTSTSPSLNVRTSARPGSRSRYAQMARISSGCAFPEKIFMLPLTRRSPL